MVDLQKMERLLELIIYPDLERGRPNWDKPHTELVVKYVKLLIQNAEVPNLDEAVLIIAAYAHDWGYADLYGAKSKISYNEMLDTKKMHMQLGAEKIEKLLNNKIFDVLSAEQKARIVHLVGIHDKISALSAIDELILMEADTLGGLEGNEKFGTLNDKEQVRYINGVKHLRIPKFITEYGKSIAYKFLNKSK
jgi:hypothetical protein